RAARRRSPPMLVIHALGEWSGGRGGSAITRARVPRRGRSGGCDDRDPPASLLPQGYANFAGLERERCGDVVPDADGQRLAEGAFVAEPCEVELERLRLEAQACRAILDRRGVEI